VDQFSSLAEAQPGRAPCAQRGCSRLVPRTQGRLVTVTLPVGDGPRGLQQLPQPLACDTAQHSIPGWDSAPGPLRTAHAGSNTSRGGGRWHPTPRCPGTGQAGPGPAGTQLTRVAAELRHSPLASVLALQRHDAQHTCRRGHQSRSPACPSPTRRSQEQPTPPQPGTWGGHPALPCKSRDVGPSAPLEALGENLLHSS